MCSWEGERASSLVPALVDGVRSDAIAHYCRSDAIASLPSALTMLQAGDGRLARYPLIRRGIVAYSCGMYVTMPPPISWLVLEGLEV